MQEQLETLRLKLIERRGLQLQLDELNAQMSRISDQMRELSNRRFGLDEEINAVQQVIAG